MQCDCWYHRYHVVHVWNGRIYDHSQGTADDVFRDVPSNEILSFPSDLYEHGMTAEELALKALRETPQDPRIFNRRQSDGTFRPLSQFFEREKP